MNKPIREGFVSDEPVETPQDVSDNVSSPEPVEQVGGEIWPIKVRLLNKPIRNNKGEEVSELIFREPTGGDIARHGNPVRIDWNGDAFIDDKRMLFMMTALSGIMTPFLEKMDPRDYNSCAYRLRNFFLPDTAAW